MSLVSCKYCGAPIRGDTCKYCNHKVDSESLIDYKALLESKVKSYSSISQKLMNLEDLTPEENSILISLYENDLIGENEIFFDQILYGALSGHNIVNIEVFENVIKKSGESLMKAIVGEMSSKENTDYIHTFIKTMDSNMAGGAKEHHYFCFDKSVIERLYKGDLAALTLFFHEMYHGYYDLVMKSGKTNEMITTMIKERIILNVNPDYYERNYRDNLEEMCVNKAATNYTLSLLKQFNIEVPKGFVESEEALYSTDFDNRNRVVTIDGREEIRTVDEIFDDAIQLVPDMLREYPQLGLEYINENGVIRKKNIDELSASLNGDRKPEETQYIQSLIDKSQTGFHMY